jgi:hypothetical protein
MHVEACLEMSRDGGSNPPASISYLYNSLYNNKLRLMNLNIFTYGSIMGVSEALKAFKSV